MILLFAGRQLRTQGGQISALACQRILLLPQCGFLNKQIIPNKRLVETSRQVQAGCDQTTMTAEQSVFLSEGTFCRACLT